MAIFFISIAKALQLWRKCSCYRTRWGVRMIPHEMYNVGASVHATLAPGILKTKKMPRGLKETLQSCISCFKVGRQSFSFFASFSTRQSVVERYIILSIFTTGSPISFPLFFFFLRGGRKRRPRRIEPRFTFSSILFKQRRNNKRKWLFNALCLAEVGKVSISLVRNVLNKTTKKMRKIWIFSRMVAAAAAEEII